MPTTPIPFIVDLHCHPTTKPYGHSFKKSPIGKNSSNPNDEHSIWYNDSPNAAERLLQTWAEIVKFRQADLCTLAWGNCRVVVASLYPIERGFFRNKFGEGLVSDLVGSFVSGVSRKRVNYVQNVTNYFEDLVREYEYYQQLNDQPININGTTYLYKLVHSYREIASHQMNSPADVRTIFIVFSIEGLHCLDNNIDGELNEAAVLENLKRIKEWEYAPFFVTVAHHFNNKLCGHAKSLFGLVGKKADQSEGLNKKINASGLKVIDLLLDSSVGKRILIDVKHMSLLSRLQYYDLLDGKFKNDTIPVVISHGAVAGRTIDGVLNKDNPALAKTFFPEDINFYDEEIIRMTKSGGIIGLQLDERRLATKEKIKSLRNPLFLNEIRHVRAELVWNQIQYIAELLNNNRLFAWDTMALGTDFDGIINPVNGFLTAEELNALMEYVERHAYNYMNGRGKEVLSRRNQITSAQIVERIFSLNATAFLTKWFV